MAYVKIYFNNSAFHTLHYIRDRSPDDPAHSENCSIDGAATDFESVRTLHNDKEKTQAIHIVQSFPEKEKQQLSPEEFNKIGRDLVEKNFPGYQYVIATHTDKLHIHNHIVINPVHPETGKRIQNKKHHLKDLRGLSDKLCKERGLSVIDEKAQERKINMPDKAQRIERFRGQSWIFDLTQKANFARGYSTSYDEYVGLLKGLNIDTRVESKNITYFYPGINQGKRGSKLGRNFDKLGLEKAFASNFEKFSSHPELKKTYQSDLQSLSQNKVNSEFQKRDFSKFSKVERNSPLPYPSDELVKSSIVPIDEIRRARSGSIFDYCRRQKIELTAGQDGQSTLKGRSNVIVSEFEWQNTKNKTRGSLIEFVAAHQNVSFLQAISKINNNPKLLLLEQYFGEQKRTYTSFYVPSKDSMSFPQAASHLSSFLKQNGIKTSMADPLLKHQRVQIHKNGSIRFFPEGEPSGALEFKEDSERKWTPRREGKLNSPFLKKLGTGKVAKVYLDPLSALKGARFDLFSQTKHSDGLLALFEPNPLLVDRFVAENSQLKDLQIIHSKNTASSSELNFFNLLKVKYANLGLKVELIPLGKSQSMKQSIDFF